MSKQGENLRGDETTSNPKYRRYVQHAFLRDYGWTADSRGVATPNSNREQRKLEGGRFIENHYNKTLLPSLSNANPPNSHGFEGVLDLHCISLNNAEKETFSQKWNEFKEDQSTDRSAVNYLMFAQESEKLVQVQSQLEELSEKEEDTKKQAAIAVLEGYVDRAFPLIQKLSHEPELSPWLVGVMSCYSNDNSSFWEDRINQLQVLAGICAQSLTGGGSDSIVCNYYGVASKENIMPLLLQLYQFMKASTETKLNAEGFKQFLHARSKSSTAIRLVLGDDAACEKLFACITAGHYDGLYMKIKELTTSNQTTATQSPALSLQSWVELANNEDTADLENEATLLTLQEKLIAGYSTGNSALNELTTTLADRNSDLLINNDTKWIPITAPYLVAELLKKPNNAFKKQNLSEMLGNYLLTSQRELNSANFAALMHAMQRSYEETAHADDQLNGHDCDIVFELLAKNENIASQITAEQLKQIEAVDSAHNRAVIAYFTAIPLNQLEQKLVGNPALMRTVLQRHQEKYTTDLAAAKRQTGVLIAYLVLGGIFGLIGGIVALVYLVENLKKSKQLSQEIVNIKQKLAAADSAIQASLQQNTSSPQRGEADKPAMVALPAQPTDCSNKSQGELKEKPRSVSLLSIFNKGQVNNSNRGRSRSVPATGEHPVSQMKIGSGQ